MGVPSFFSWLFRVIKNIEFDKLPKIDYLHIDANSLFHVKCQEVLNDHQTTVISEYDLETLMIEKIISSLELLISIINPKKTYILVDGVPPMGKVKQQRLRRYKRISDDIVINNRNKKFGIKKRLWNNVKITPGTPFMNRLNIELSKYSQKAQNVVYSSYKNPGEGEHKIMNLIKKFPGKCVIFGMDTDLLFLSMILNIHYKSNVYLIRENNIDFIAEKIKTSRKSEKYENFIDINKCITALETYIKNTYYEKFNKSFPKKISMIDDFIFLTFFAGNDFVPSSILVDTKMNGIFMLLNQYLFVVKTLFTSFVFVDIVSEKYCINARFMDKFLFGLTARKLTINGKYYNVEDSYFKHKLPGLLNNHKKKCNTKISEYTNELVGLETQKNSGNTNTLELTKKINLIKYDIDKETHDLMANKQYNDLGLFNEPKFFYSKKYYKQLFGIVDHEIDDLCKEYHNSLCWTAQYYYFGCPSWTWYYPYTKAPLMNDVYFYYRKLFENYSDGKKYINITQNCNYSLESPINIYTQLLLVVPCKYIELIPEKFRWLMTSNKSPILDLFPLSIIIETACEYIEWKCMPKMPRINYARINNEVLKIINS